MAITVDPPNEIERRRTSAGLIPVPPGTFEHDVAVSDRFQKFSSELLRLSLAGIGAVGFLVISSPPRAGLAGLSASSYLGLFVIVSLLMFGLSSALALLHLYIGSESKAYHLKYLRLESAIGGNDEIRAIPRKTSFSDCLELYWAPIPDQDKADAIKVAAIERDIRDFLFRVSKRLLFWSGVSLWLGAMFLTFTILNVLF